MNRLVLLLLLLIGFNASATESDLLYLCNWCETRTDFINLAESNGLSLQVNNEAEYQVIVVNDVDKTLYKGTLLVENWNGSVHATAFLMPGSPELHDAYIEIKDFLVSAANGEFVVTMPPDTWSIGGGSFNGRQREIVGGVISQHPEYTDAVLDNFFGTNGASTLRKLLNIFFTGDYPKVIVVFGNGDVATYEITAIGSSGALALEYVEGTGRDRNGNVLPDGSGTTSGGSYVAPYGSGGIRIYASEDYVWVICSRTGSGPWTCYIEESVE